ncbi:MAG TPA: SusE domain-containing protein [Cyclobacteriaceae bacterium]|nr:SusE domain-containing protein [Cyclobacteriaceae bacterium]
MKEILKKTYLLLFVLTLVWSCEEEDNLEPLGNWELSAPVLGSPTGDVDLVLDENNPESVTKFDWEAAVASNRFGVAYTFVLVPQGSDDFENPLLQITPGNGGKNLFVEPTADQIDYALWAACYAPGSKVNLEWAVIARAIEKKTFASRAASFTRFATERKPSTLFITGDATEAGEDITNAMAMRARKDADGNPTYIFDTYTTLSNTGSFQFRDQANLQSRSYGGDAGALEGCGPGIASGETAQYRIKADLNDDSYELLKIEKWSLVGDAVEGGWGGDVPLTYKGNGVWEAKIEFYQPYDGAGFIFRANGDWGYLLKRVNGTATPDNNGGEVIMESEAGDAGLEFEDMPGPEAGIYTVTLDLSADGYTYSLVKDTNQGPAVAVIGESNNPDGDAVSGNFEFGTYDLPDQLFLMSDGSLITELTKDGNVFRSVKFLALEANRKYILNSADDGSGTTYNEIGDGTISVARDQAYQVNVDFESGKLSWKYYNLKLFHWDEVGGGWDSRLEAVMTYIHPYKFEVTASLSAGYHSKFISPWDIQFGTSDTALTGTMTNGGANYTGIAQNGTYKASIEITDDYSSCTYSFVKQ